jgi:predicted Kef-type K+ transport protein
MFIEAIWISLALLLGLLARGLGLPPLLGYLAAGFAISKLSEYITLPAYHNQVLEHLAHAGVLLLLFTVGLKLNIKKIFKWEVVGTGFLHMAISVLVFTPVIHIMFNVEIYKALLLASALSFSSTVLAAKVLESKKELKAFHGRLAIGILIIQDLLAMAVMSATSGHTPSIYALGLLALPLLRPVMFKLLDVSGHDEMLLLCGLGFALVLGGMGFSTLGLSGELGALIMGAMVAKHAKSSELYQTLWGLKEIFLVCFFLTIGLKGMPNASDWLFAITMVILLPLQAIAFFGLLTLFKLKSRSAFLTTTTLTNFSEFGLIVAAVAAPDWMIPLSLAVALSFLISAPLNKHAHPLFDMLEKYLSQFERNVRHPDEQPISLGDTKLLIMGMGQVGRAAYKAAKRSMDDITITGLDSDADKIDKLKLNNYNCHYADAEHGNFWTSLDTSKIESVVLAMDCPDASRISTNKLRESGYKGLIVAHSKHIDDAKKIELAGADFSYVTLDEAGQGLISHILTNGKF